MAFPIAQFGRRLLRSRLAWAYVILLLASHALIGVRNPDWFGISDAAPPPGAAAVDVEVSRVDRDGPVDGSMRITGYRWPASEETDRAPIILVHGSPSRGALDFVDLAPALASRGRDVIAIDRPGWGGSEKWVRDYSMEANAHVVLEVMDALDIPRAHLLAWSWSGGTVLHVADMAPERVASLTLMAALGIQEAEGSGDYHFEHGKYAMGWLLFVALPEITPHFNLLGPRWFRHAFIRDFWDSDQRPLRDIMTRLETPTLILHGRRDFLIPAWAAEAHHDLMPHSRLVIFEGGHFLPFSRGPEDHKFRRVVASIDDMAARHDEPGEPTLEGRAIFSPQREKDRSIGGITIHRSTPWFLIILLIALATFISEDLTVIAVGLLVSSGSLDFGVGLVGCFLGIIAGDIGLWAIGRYLGRGVVRHRFFRRFVTEASLQRWSRLFEKHTGKAVFLSRCLPGTRLPTYIAAGILAQRTHLFLMWVLVAVFVWTPILLILTLIIGPPLLGFFEGILHGPWAIIASFIVLFLIIKFLSYEATWEGRHRLKADLGRLHRIEFWPPLFFYAPLVPWLAWLSLRRGGPMTFTCVNPGIPNGGGVVGESKSDILQGFGSHGGLVLPNMRIPTHESPEARAAMLTRMLGEDDRFEGYPVILKPEEGERGRGVELIRDQADAASYFDWVVGDVQAQLYHAGPHEAGVLWTRRPDGDEPLDERPGRIFSVTRKVFPEITGDGEHSIAQLIWMHPRYRMQAKTFLKRFEDSSDRILDDGEVFRLGVAGNHIQGTMFVDGAALITPELEERIDEIARSYRDADGRGIDYGRFDIRYESDDALRRGEGFAIIEFNGTTAESTNIYDPKRSVLWTYRVLYRQWATLYRLGQIRRVGGQRPVSIGRVIRLIREHRKRGVAPKVSD